MCIADGFSCTILFLANHSKSSHSLVMGHLGKWFSAVAISWHATSPTVEVGGIARQGEISVCQACHQGMHRPSRGFCISKVRARFTVQISSVLCGSVAASPPHSPYLGYFFFSQIGWPSAMLHAAQPSLQPGNAQAVK